LEKVWFSILLTFQNNSLSSNEATMDDIYRFFCANILVAMVLLRAKLFFSNCL